ncbi:hypothetical protein D3C78_1540980 [compost metagenome]
MLRLCLCPASKHFVNRIELNIRELISILGLYTFKCRPVVIFSRNRLSFFRIQIFQVSIGNLTSASLIYIFINYSYRRLSKDTFRRIHNIKLVWTQLLNR